MSTIITSFILAFEAFATNKLRTALAVLGVMIGIATIIIVFASGEGIKSLLADQVDAFGADVVQAEIKIPSSKKGAAGETQSAMALLQGAQVTTMNHEDLEDTLKIPNIKNGYGLYMGQELITYKNETKSTLIWSTGAAMIDIDTSQVEHGRFFTSSEDDSLASVIVLGSKIKDDLFGHEEAVGEKVKVGTTKFRVVGIMEERGSVATFNFDEMVYIPVQTMQKKVVDVDYFHNLWWQIDDMTIVDQTMEEIREVMRENHDIDPPENASREDIFDTGQDDFRVVSMIEALEIFDDMYIIITLLLLAIVAISLVVGGVGVMNVMYVIVQERTPEIGLRKAVGASYEDIMAQFLVESILITMLGGVAGVISGAGISWFISFAAAYSGYAWTFAIPIAAYITAFIFSVVFGVLFGLYPARNAAQMSPIEALQKNN